MTLPRDPARRLGAFVLAAALAACGGGTAAVMPAGAAGAGGALAGAGGAAAAAGGASGAAGAAGANGQGGSSGSGGLAGGGSGGIAAADDAGTVDAGTGNAGTDAGSDTAPTPLEPDEPIPADRPARQSQGCPAEEANPRVLFDIPRAGDVASDFYRLPFPNDIRRRDGRIKLADFPRPFLVISPVVDRVLKAIESEGLPFGTNPLVTFRLSRDVDPQLFADGAAAARFVDLTTGQLLPHRLSTSASGTYLCPRNLLVEARDGVPLSPGHTYAVLLTNALVDKAGQPFARDTDFGVMLARTAPDGTERRAAWQDYAPLRAWLATGPIDKARVVAAAVFTVGAVDQPAARLRAAVRATAAPVVKDLVRCGPGASSVCDDGRTSGCAAAAPGAPYVEYQGRIEIPVFQQGTPPYETTGGGISYDGAGTPQVARREDVCFSLTVPKGTAPASGWPVVIYGHGTGGNFRGPVESRFADELARAEAAGGAVPMATFSFDGVLHGSRKGNSTRGTDELVYNVFNPTASRDNGLQAAADDFAMARALPLLNGELEAALDLSRVGLYGHSQGGNAAAIAGGYEPDFGAVVLSGTGGGIARSLLEKEKPVAAKSLLPLLIGEAVADARHPVLAMMQLYFDSADPLNHGRRIAATPMAGMTSRHLLHVYGTNDHYAPESTQLGFAVGAGLPVLNPLLPLSNFVLVGVVDSPVQGNFTLGGRAVTALSAQYAPAPDYDGHFVSTRNAAAANAIRGFFASYFRTGMPVVP
jgi:hypothetical protein